VSQFGLMALKRRRVETGAAFVFSVLGGPEIELLPLDRRQGGWSVACRTNIFDVFATDTSPFCKSA